MFKLFHPSKISSSLGAATLAALLSLTGCASGDNILLKRIAVDGDRHAAQQLAQKKTTRYISNPQALKSDIQSFQRRVAAFRSRVDKVWGRKQRKESNRKTYVKYSDGYRARSVVTFDSGTVTVQSVDSRNPKLSLENALVGTLLAPADPRNVDLFSDRQVEFKGEPFLYNQVKDQDGKAIRWQWRARRFARYLVATKMRTSRLSTGQTVHSVSFPLQSNHMDVRAHNYADIVNEQSRRFNVDRSLIYAVIKTESNFNPFAVSHIPAFGLMQIVPRSAGVEVRRNLTGSKTPPTKSFLFNARNNITYGTAYLHILDTSHLAKVRNPQTREYCVIAAYNTGAGNVFRTFSRNRNDAAQRINSMSPSQVYAKLKSDLPYAETRRYIQKVLSAKKEFSGA